MSSVSAAETGDVAPTAAASDPATPAAEPTATSAPDPTAAPTGTVSTRSVLLVLGDAGALNTSEVAIHQRLVDRGYAVEVAVDDTVTPADADGHSLVVVSKTIQSALAGGTFAETAAGVLFWEDNAQSLSMMATIDDSRQADTAWHATGSEIELDPAAPDALRAGLAGTIPFLESAGQITYAPAEAGISTLSGDAIKIGQVAPPDGRWAYYAYEAGGLLADGSVAAGRRAYFGLYDDTYMLLTPDGEALFDAAVDWASTGRSQP